MLFAHLNEIQQTVGAMSKKKLPHGPEQDLLGFSV